MSRLILLFLLLTACSPSQSEVEMASKDRCVFTCVENLLYRTKALTTGVISEAKKLCEYKFKSLRCCKTQGGNYYTSCRHTK